MRLTVKTASNGHGRARRRISGHWWAVLRTQGAKAVTIQSMACERWIVVGTDFSEGAHEALERALGLAQDSGARIALVHAYEDEPGAKAPADPTSRLQGQLDQ